MMAIIKGLVELIKGMGITGKHLGKHAITIQYPEEKMPMFERSRGVIVLLSDKETGELNCTACELCMRACPTAAIDIVAPRDPETKKKTLEKFEIDFGLCCYCGLCEEACNFSALKMTGKYEYSTVEKDDIIWDVNKLQETGRDVDYEDTRKKKPVKKAEPKKEAPKKKDATAEVKEEPKEKAPEAPQTETPAPNPGEDKPDNETKSE